MTESVALSQSTAKWVLASADATVEITATIVGGNVVFNYALVSGVADLNGFYIDINNDGGKIKSLGGGNNMNGAGADGDKLDGFDYATALGTVGGNDADNTSGTVTVSLSALKITSLDQLATAEVGIRATSVGEDREGSLKLAGTGEVCVPPEPEDLCDRPLDGASVSGWIEMQDAQITQLTLNFYDLSGAHKGDTSGDWYYSVAINVPAEMGEDPDAYLDQLVAMLIEQDVFVESTDWLKSVVVTDCHGNRTNYNTRDFNQDDPANPESPDHLPWTVYGDLDHVLTPETDIAGHTDATYQVELSGDSFVFA